MKNNGFLLVFVFCFLIGCVSTSSQSDEKNVQYDEYGNYSTVPEDTERLHFRKYENGFIIFDLYETTRFYLKGSGYPEVYCSISYKEFGKLMPENPQGRINKIKINDIMVPYSDKNLEPIINGDKIIIPLEVTVGEEKYVFNFNVEEIPISIDMSYNDIISILGQPNDESKNIFDTWSLDYPGASDYNNRYRESWVLVYNKYPHRAFFLNPDGILKRFDIH